MWCFSSLHLLLVCIFHLISAERSYHFLYFNSTWYLSALMWCVLSVFLNKEHQLDRVRNSVQWFCDSLLLQWVVVYVPLPRKIKTKKLRKCKKIEKKEKLICPLPPQKGQKKTNFENTTSTKYPTKNDMEKSTRCIVYSSPPSIKDKENELRKYDIEQKQQPDLSLNPTPPKKKEEKREKNLPYLTPEKEGTKNY